MRYLFNLLLLVLISHNAMAKDFFEDESFEVERKVYYDPLEPFNRLSFAAFKGASVWVILPLAKSYDFLTPNFLQPHILSVFNNLDMPLDAINGTLLPHKNITIKASTTFLTNTFFGLGGFFNIHDAYKAPQPSFLLEDIAQYYFNKPLPYLVIPMGFGNVFSLASWYQTSKLYSFTNKNATIKNAMVGYTVGNIIVKINNSKEQIEDTFNNSIDSYSILRNVYYQSQSGKLQSLKANDAKTQYRSLISSEFI